MIFFLVSWFLTASVALASPLVQDPTNPPACAALSATVTEVRPIATQPAVRVRLSLTSPSLRLTNAELEWYNPPAHLNGVSRVVRPTTQTMLVTQPKNLADSLDLRAVHIPSTAGAAPLICRFIRPTPHRMANATPLYNSGSMKTLARSATVEDDGNSTSSTVISTNEEAWKLVPETILDINDGASAIRSNYSLLISVFTEYASMRSEFKALQYRMADTCKYTLKKRNLYKRAKAKLKILTIIPLGALRTFAKNVFRVGDRIDEEVLGTPNDPICKAIDKVNAYTDTLNKKFTKVLNKVSDVVKYADKAFEGLEISVDAIEGNWKDILNELLPLPVVSRVATGSTDAQPVCPNALVLRDNMDATRNASNEALQIIQDISAEVQRVLTSVETVLSPADKFSSFVKDLFGGPFGKVLNTIEKIFNLSVKLPIPGGSKSRGVGLVPRCCPSGYKAGVAKCFEKCRDGYEEIDEGCWQKCGSGWKTVLLTCVKHDNPFNIKGRKHYTRKNKNFGCSCHKTKHSLEAGLCYAKCGEGAFAKYGTPSVTLCVDYSMKKITLSDLTNQLDIFKKINKIPGLGDAIKAVEKTLDKIMNPIISVVLDLADVKVYKFKFDYPSFKFDTSVAKLDSLSAKMEAGLDEINRIKQNPQCS